MRDKLKIKIVNVTQNDNEYYNAWGWKRIVAAVASGGASEAMAAVTNRDPETGRRNDNPGGDKWSKKQAENFYAKVPGKVETVRRVINAILGTAPDKIKDNHKGDWAGIAQAAKNNKPILEERWNLIQKYAQDFDNETNRAEAKFNYTKIWELEKWALKADDQRHIWSTVRDIDKVISKVNSVQLAPIRGVILFAIKLNILNLATYLKLAMERKPEAYTSFAYKWKQMGGNRTDLAKAINKSFKKRPIGSTKIDVKNLSADAWNANGEQKTLKIPGTIGGALAAIVVAIWPSKDPASTSGVTISAAAAGTIVTGLVSILNEAKIPLGPGENNAEIKSAEDIATDINYAEKNDPEAKKIPFESFIDGVPNWATISGGIVLLTGGTYGIIELVKYLKNK